MTRAYRYATKRALLFAGLFLVFPLVTFAATFGPALPTIKSVTLQASLQIDGKPVKSPAIIATNADFTIVWRSLGAGCVSNWSGDTLPASGSSVGSITESRPFVITCYGRGAAQSVKMQVNVGSADLAPSSFSAVGLKSAKGKKGSYLALPFTLKTSVRNTGKLAIGVPFQVKYQESSDGQTGWISVGERTISEMRGGTTVKVEELPRQGNIGSGMTYYQVCVDPGNKVTESREDNNCSKVLGPYSFVAAP